MSVSAYRYEASKLITLIGTGDEDEFFNDLAYVNELDPVDARGLELEGEMRKKRGIQAHGSYVWQRAVNRESRAVLTNSPRGIASARLSVPGPLQRSSIAVDLRYLSGRRTLGGNVAPSHTVTNVIVTAPIKTNLEFVATIKNLFSVSLIDPSSDEHVPDTIEHEGRTFRAGIRWTFGRQ
jgi:outer membrane receptor protein involved in Fe transport